MADVLSALTSNVGKVVQENRQFRMAAAQQNGTISKFIRDIGKLFSSNSKQNSDLTNALGDIQQTTATTAQKVTDTNNLLQESIGIQTQMLSELKNISKSLLGLGDNEESGWMGLAKDAAKFGLGAAAGGLIGGSGMLGGGAGMLGDMIGGNMQAGSSDTGGGEKLAVADMVKLAKEAGFSDEEAVVMGAIAAAESSGNTKAHNPNAGTGDNSYGLWQINMLGNLGPERRQQFGINSNDQLFDPKVNASAARVIYNQQGFDAWSVYKSGAYRQYLGTATKALQGGSEAPTPEGDGDVMEKSGPVNLQKYSLKDPSHVQGLNPGFKSSLGRFLQDAEAAGHSIKLYSGYRSPERQKQLFHQAVMKYGSPEAARKWVAPPGRSRHNHGTAADLKYSSPEARRWAHENAAKYGLTFRMGHEPWHIEPANASSTADADAYKVGGDEATSSMGMSFNGGSAGESSSGAGLMASGDGGGEGGGESQNWGDALQGTPLAGMSGLANEYQNAFNFLSKGAAGMGSLLTGGGGGMLGGLLGGMGGMMPDLSGMLGSLPGMAMNAIGSIASNIEGSNESSRKSAAIENVAVERDVSQMQMASLQTGTNPVPTDPRDTMQPNQDLYRGGAPSLSTYSASPSWYQQLAGRINNDESMKLKGGVLA